MSHAELVVVPVEHPVVKPESLSWDVAGCMYVALALALGVAKERINTIADRHTCGKIVLHPE